jgi:hypothetical protein
VNKDLIINYINEIYPKHTDISIWSINYSVRYNYTIDNDIMRLSDDGYILITDIEEWIIDKRDLKIDKIII